MSTLSASRTATIAAFASAMASVFSACSLLRCAVAFASADCAALISSFSPAISVASCAICAESLSERAVR